MACCSYISVVILVAMALVQALVREVVRALPPQAERPLTAITWATARGDADDVAIGACHACILACMCSLGLGVEAMALVAPAIVFGGAAVGYRVLRSAAAMD